MLRMTISRALTPELEQRLKHAARQAARFWAQARQQGTPAAGEKALDADPQELKNLAGDPAQASTLARLRARCDEYRETQ
jgi:hypothetical protein